MPIQLDREITQDFARAAGLDLPGRELPKPDLGARDPGASPGAGDRKQRCYV